ncbi:MAG: hypothetical protein ABII75_07065 [Candidatus Omnitrophota bacterium]
MIKKLKIIFTGIIFIYLFPFLCYAEQEYYSFPAASAQGEWQISEVEDTKVLLTNKADVKGYLDMEVPREGCYQLYVNLYHEWKKSCPFLYIEALDSKGKYHSGYLFSEPRWYLKEDGGRWEMRSPSAIPYWRLPRGQLKIKFWIEAKSSCWEQKKTDMEEEVILKNFIIIPIDEKSMLQKNIDI